MTKPNSITISAPFDARHVNGVSIPGATVPVVGMTNFSTTVGPDFAPSHTNISHGNNVEIPRRSNTVTSTLDRPNLKLKTSMSLLRGRSNSKNRDREATKQEASELRDMSPGEETRVHSLRKKSSTSRFWQKVHHRTPRVESPQQQEEDLTPDPLGEEAFISNSKPLNSIFPSSSTGNPYTYQVALPPAPRPPIPIPQQLPAGNTERPPVVTRLNLQKELPPVRPKRADSGTAIDFRDPPAVERPLVLRQILAVPSFEERMTLYKKTRDYWARTDHGLNEWVGRAGPEPPFQV